MSKEFKLTEEEIKEVVLNGLREKVNTRYTYEYVDRAVAEVMSEDVNYQLLKNFVRETLSWINNDKAFKNEVKAEFQRKVAKSMVGKLEGTVERAVDAIRQDQTLRAEMILAVEKIIKKNT
jgi:hypothetical protein